ncbi:MAG: AAA family ATPase, partial [Planctomycetota bacterium]
MYDPTDFFQQPRPRNRASAVPEVVRLDTVEPARVKWLWNQRLALGKLTLIAGDPGLGKSYLTLDLAARVSTGTAMPGDRPDHT